MPEYKIEWLNPERTEAIVTKITGRWFWKKARQAEVYRPGSYWRFKATEEVARELDGMLDRERGRANIAEMEAKHWQSCTELPKAKVVQK